MTKELLLEDSVSVYLGNGGWHEFHVIEESRVIGYRVRGKKNLIPLLTDALEEKKCFLWHGQGPLKRFTDQIAHCARFAALWGLIPEKEEPEEVSEIGLEFVQKSLSELDYTPLPQMLIPTPRGYKLLTQVSGQWKTETIADPSQYILGMMSPGTALLVVPRYEFQYLIEWIAYWKEAIRCLANETMLRAYQVIP